MAHDNQLDSLVFTLVPENRDVVAVGQTAVQAGLAGLTPSSLRRASRSTPPSATLRTSRA
ncbi:hypothetical protein FRAAL2586 [Frankia alni ACN14a]|uniref:Uncharacterized protein n=1 Tax=Frankia alni (strain DSM 45986 / CECT 9034 / ACN14a) TaxID=326424 RepID=Q0RML7_FRAAA|nr:hypothetical protein FRAAL2586 [Frankia alni ACN14a]